MSWTGQCGGGRGALPDPAGRTSEDNVGPGCRVHHVVKATPGWRPCEVSALLCQLVLRHGEVHDVVLDPRHLVR